MGIKPLLYRSLCNDTGVSPRKRGEEEKMVYFLNIKGFGTPL